MYEHDEDEPLLKISRDVTNELTSKISKNVPKKNEDPKRKYEMTKRSRGFVISWTQLFPWVRCEANTMFCNVCRKYPVIALPHFHYYSAPENMQIEFKIFWC